MTTSPIGVYVHIPYCIRKCSYCDFCSLPCGESGVPESYVDRLCEEILCYKGDSKIPASTLFFGGGTPSLLSPLQLKKIVSALNLVLDFTSDLEFTLEANPGTVDKEKLFEFRKLGVNRLSFGMQSMHSNELLALGRIHSHLELLEAVRLAREVGFDNVSCDLMYGIPYQTKESFLSTLNSLVALSPEHISVYGLMIEEGTPFYAMRDKLPLPSEDDEADMFYLADSILTKAGYLHYEISNYARAGRESRHNLKYWSASEYLGFGAAASSYYIGQRFTNTAVVSEYLKNNGVSYTIEESMTVSDLEYEYAMLNLRLKSGISLSEYKSRFGKDFTLGREEVIDRLSSFGLLVCDGERLSLSVKGFYLSNTVLTELL